MKIYCEIEFLKCFFESMPKYDPLEGSNELIHWDSYKNLFFDNCTLSFDNREEYIRMVTNDKRFLLLNKRKDGGNININFRRKEDLLNDRNTLFFCIDDTECEDLEGEGKLAISNNTRDRWVRFLFSRETVVIDGKRIRNWAFLEDYKHPCEEIIVFDNYLLDNPNDILEREIRSLFASLLPDLCEHKKLSVKFVLSANGMREKKELVEETIKELINNAYWVTFNWITINQKDQHDRFLLTNYCGISCGYGFVLGSKRSKGTSVVIHTIASQGFEELDQQWRTKLKNRT